jgi:ATP/maltotriose-dependent transcriptional regulator MalT
LTAALGRADPTARTIGRARALLATATIDGMHGDPEAARVHGEEAVELLRALGQKRELAYALVNVARATPDRIASDRASSEARALFDELGDTWGRALLLWIMADLAQERGDHDEARSGHTESLALLRGLGDLQMSTSPLMSLGRLACVDGDYARARALVEEVLAIRRRPEVDNVVAVAMALDSLGEIARCEGDPAGGTPSFEEALGYGRVLGDDLIIAWSLHNLGHVALHQGELAAADAQFRESLRLRWQWGPGVNVAAGLAGLASIAAREGKLTDAARLLGAVDGMLESTHRVLAPADAQARQRDLTDIRSRLDDRSFDLAFGEGRAAKLDQLERWSASPSGEVAPKRGSTFG